MGQWAHFHRCFGLLNGLLQNHACSAVERRILCDDGTKNYLWLLTAQCVATSTSAQLFILIGLRGNLQTTITPVVILCGSRAVGIWLAPCPCATHYNPSGAGFAVTTVVTASFNDCYWIDRFFWGETSQYYNTSKYCRGVWEWSLNLYTAPVLRCMHSKHLSL